MNQRKEARYQRAVERNLSGAEKREAHERMIRSKTRGEAGRPLRGMTIEAAAHRTGIRLSDVMHGSPRCFVRILNLID